MNECFPFFTAIKYCSPTSCERELLKTVLQRFARYETLDIVNEEGTEMKVK